MKEKDDTIENYLRGRARGRGCDFRRGNYNSRGRGRGRNDRMFNNSAESNQRQSTRWLVRGNLSKRGGTRAPVQCYNCEKYGHYASECRNAAVKEKKALCAKDGDSKEPTLLMNMTGKKNFFISLDESFKGDISFRDARKVYVQGRGDILIQAKNGTHQFITQVIICLH